MLDDRAALIAEYRLCRRYPTRFLRRHVKIEMVDDEGGKTWAPFDLWPSQEEVINAYNAADLLVVLKARQLGQTWLFLGLLLHQLVFSPGASVALFSRREKEAIELLRRLKGMYARLPEPFRARAIVKDDATEWRLSTGSSAYAFPTSAGDSYTFNAALVDEADLCPDLGHLLNAVKPTIDGGGKLVLLSKSDKGSPQSPFKRIFRRAEAGSGPWLSVFLPWSARPGRSAAWYEAQRQHSIDQDGSLDFLHENYPASSAEALAPNSQGKRLPGPGLLAVYEGSDPLDAAQLPAALAAIEGLRVYCLPAPGRSYRIGADPAEGLPGADRDDSAISVVDRETGEQVASGLGRWEPKAAFPAIITAASKAFNNAPALIERNNHGHAVIGALEAAGEVELLHGPDGRAGYAKSPASKAQLWVDGWAEIQARRQAREAAQAAGGAPPPPLIRDAVTFGQLASLEAATCKAPSGEHDDGADAWGLAQFGRQLEPPGGVLMAWV